MPSGPSPPAAAPQQAPGFKPNYDILSSMNTSRPASQVSTPARTQSPQVRQTATPPAADPFASLVSASPRPASSAFHSPAQNQPAPGSSLLDLMGGPNPPPQPAGQAAPEDDEWNFASSLPQSNMLPSTNQVQVLNSQLRVDFHARRVPNAPRQIYLRAVFSNTTNQPIGDLHFQVAVEKVSKNLFIPWHWAETKYFPSPTRSSFAHSLAERLRLNSRMVCNKTCSWTALTLVKATR